MDETVDLSNKRPKCSGDDGTAAGEKVNVYVWDMDETLVLFKSLLDRSYAKARGGVKDAQRGVEIGKMWENLILELCGQHFLYNQIEDHNEPSLGALSEFDDGCDLAEYNFDRDEFTSTIDDASKRKLVHRYRAISSMYNKLGPSCSIASLERKTGLLTWTLPSKPPAPFI